MKRLMKNQAVIQAVYCLLYAAGLLTLWYYFITAFFFPGLPFLMVAALAAGGLFAFLFVALEKKPRRIAMLALALVWLAAVLFQRQRLGDGMLAAFQYLIPNMYKIINYDFGATMAATAASEADCTLFLTCLLMPIAALLCWAVVGRRSGLFSLMFTLPLFGFTWALRGTPPGPVLVLLFVFWLTMLVQGRMSGVRGPAEALTPILCILVSAGILSTLILAVPRDDYKLAPAATGVKDTLVNAALEIEYSGSFSGLPGFSVGSPLTRSDGSVNLNSAGNIRFSDREVLRVHANQPQDLFLRGYAASDYTGNRWVQADADAFEAAGIDFEPLMYAESTRALSFRGSHGAQGGSSGPNEITVEVLDGKTNYMFTPYLITGPSQLAPGAEWMGDAYLAPGDTLEYTFETSISNWYNPLITGSIEQLYEDDSWAVLAAYSGYLDSHTQPDGTLEYEGHSLPYVVTQWGPILLYDENIPEDVFNRAFNAIYNSRSQPGHVDIPYPDSRRDAEYMRYIIEEYTRLPEGLGEHIREWRTGFYDEADIEQLQRDINAGDTPYYYWIYTAAEVAGQIRDSAEYTTSPGGQPMNRDFVEYFLTESQKGYCVHFASATVVTLRALGIPARYVEGYVVGQSAFDEDGWATVPAKSAHAWAEIWIPDMGWIPVESTPGGAAVAQSVTRVPAQPENQHSERAPREERDPARDEQSNAGDSAAPETDLGNNETDSGNGAGGEDGQARLWDHPAVRAAAYALLALAGLCALLLGFRGARLAWRRRLLHDSNPNRAALNAYAGLAKLERYGVVIPESATAIALKARFSQHTATKDELATMRAELARARDELARRSGRMRRLLLWLQFI